MTGAAPDARALREAMGRFPTGVAMLSTVVDGVDHAMTANSLASVSLEPLLVLVCVEKRARFHDAVLAAGVWGASLLPAHARQISDALAVRGRPLAGQLDGIPHHRGRATGVALVDDALATVECRTRQAVPAGDHTVLIADVLAVAFCEHAGEPLVYHRGRYRMLEAGQSVPGAPEPRRG